MHEKTTNDRHEVLALAFLLLLSCSLSVNVRASESELSDAEIEAVAHSARSWCPAGSSVPSYDAYPGTVAYPERAAGPGDEWRETFNEYANNEIVECASGKSLRPHLDVSEQCLRKQTISDGRTGYAASVEHALLDCRARSTKNSRNGVQPGPGGKAGALDEPGAQDSALPQLSRQEGTRGGRRSRDVDVCPVQNFERSLCGVVKDRREDVHQTKTVRRKQLHTPFGWNVRKPGHNQ